MATIRRRSTEGAVTIAGARVFIPQEPMKRDPGTQRMVSVMNFSQARAFGTPVVMCPSGPAALNTAPTEWTLREHLKDFSDQDFLIAVGDPTLFGMASIIAAGSNRGRVRFLKWDKELHNYIEVDFHQFRKLNQEED